MADIFCLFFSVIRKTTFMFLYRNEQHCICCTSNNNQFQSCEFLRRRSLKLNLIVILKGDLNNILNSPRENVLNALYAFSYQTTFFPMEGKTQGIQALALSKHFIQVNLVHLLFSVFVTDQNIYPRFKKITQTAKNKKPILAQSSLKKLAKRKSTCDSSFLLLCSSRVTMQQGQRKNFLMDSPVLIPRHFFDTSVDFLPIVSTSTIRVILSSMNPLKVCLHSIKIEMCGSAVICGFFHTN